MKYLFPLFIFWMLVIFLPSCKPMPNNGIPFYMKMDSVSLTTTGSQGLNTQNVTDVWVNANGVNLGAYELPTNYPVLDANEVRFTVSAGIWVSGQAGVRDIYPFYLPDTFTINATPGLKYHHKPHFTYKNATQITFDDEAGFAAAYDSMVNVAGPYGQCGQITVTNTDTDIISTQHRQYALPNDQEVWVEIDYKADVPFWVGLNGYVGGGSASPVPVVFVVPSTKWTKMYIKLTDLVSQTSQYAADAYSLYFEVLKPVGENAGSIYLDNIKIVHFYQPAG